MARTKAFEESVVLQKAIDLFWEKGYNGTSMDDLVKTMGINRASLYNTFQNKQGLYEKALKEYRKVNNSRVLEFLQTNEAEVETLQKLFKMAIQKEFSGVPNSRGCFLVNSTTELANLDSDIKKIVKENNRKVVKAFRTFLERMQIAKKLNKQKDLDGLANLLFVSYTGLRINAMMGINTKTNEAAANTLLSLLD